jgi:hypothetical protein
LWAGTGSTTTTIVVLCESQWEETEEKEKHDEILVKKVWIFLGSYGLGKSDVNVESIVDRSRNAGTRH